MTIRPTGPQPQHPQAKIAIFLAYLFDTAHPDLITTVMNKTRCPRHLYVLATQLMKGHK